MTEHLKSLKVQVTEQLNQLQLSGAVKDAVVKHLTDQEIKRRVDAILVAIEKHKQLQTDFYKLKADQVHYSDDGKVVSETYSKECLDKRKEAKEKLDKFDKIVDDALTNGNYEKLYQMVK